MQFHHIRILIILIIGFLFSACSEKPKSPENKLTSLNVNWELQKEDKTVDTVNFPFSLIETLYLNQSINDPNYEDDLEDINIDTELYSLKKEIQIEANTLTNKQFVLNIGNINGSAEVYINENLVGTSSSYYQTQNLYINSHLKPGTNYIFIKFNNQSSQNKHPKFQNGTKQNMAHNNIGCLNNFNVHEIKNVSFTKPYVDYSNYSNNTLEAFWNIPVQSNSNQLLTFEWSFNGKQYKEEKQVKKGQSLQTLYFPIENPKYWFPYTNGTPYMYSGELKVYDDESLIQSQALNFGVKHLKWKNNNNQIEFVLNGKSIHVLAIDYNKPNWYKWTTVDETLLYVSHLKTLGINCVRIAGNTDYLREDILALFDKAGIFVWQDLHITNLPESWTADAKVNIQLEMMSLSETYRNHPSVLSLGGKTENHNDSTKNAGLIHYEIFEQVIPQIVNTFSDLEYIPNASFVWNDNIVGFDNLSMSSFEFLDIWLSEKYKDPYENGWISKMPSEEVAHNYYDHLVNKVGLPIDIESMIYYSELMQNTYIDSILAVKRGLNPHTIHLPISYGESGPGIHPSITDYFGYRKAIFYTLLKQQESLNIRKSEKNNILSYLIHNNSDQTVQENVEIRIKDKTGAVVDILNQSITLRPNQDKSILEWNSSIIPHKWRNKDNRCIEFVFANKYERVLMNFDTAPIPYPDLKFRVIDKSSIKNVEILSNSFIPYCKIKTNHLGYFSTNFVTLLPNDTLHFPFNSEDKTYPLEVGEVDVFNYYQSFE